MQQHFPIGIKAPQELAMLCDWLKENGYPISGSFELMVDDHQAIRHWFRTNAFDDRFGVFGAGADGSLYALWRQDDGRIPIVHLGSEGVNNFVLAEDMKDFVRLLAVGYGEIGFDDLTEPPEIEGVNPAFQDWTRRTFGTAIPNFGIEITGPAGASHQNFQVWINDVTDCG
jgi:hypothetical protein